MTDRDIFAATALVGLLAYPHGTASDIDLLVRQAYDFADAMLQRQIPEHDEKEGGDGRS